MPIQFPYQIINTTGDHRIRPHTQHVIVYVDAGTVNIYLPAAENISAPISVINRGATSGVYVYPQYGKYIGGASQHRMPANTVAANTRIDLIPEVDSAGAVSGDWSFIGGNLVQFILASGAAASIAPDTITQLTNLTAAHDSAGLLASDVVTPSERAAYEVTCIVQVASLAAGERFTILFRKDADTDADSWRQSFTSNGDATQTFLSQVSVLMIPVAYRWSVEHTDAVNRTVVPLILFRRIT